MYAVALIAISAAPALAFLLLILRMDRQEPEPLGFVLRILALGAASCMVAAVVERALDLFPLFHAPGFAGHAAVSFVEVAPIEELCKLLVVLLFVWGNPNFNEENDGVVYVGASAIGFALLENVLAVAQHGLGTGLLRAFTSIPLHVFVGVVLGLNVGLARFARTPQRRDLRILWGFLLAWFFHGAYDTFALSGTELVILLLPLLAGLAAIGVAALRRGRLLSLLRWRGVVRAPAPPHQRRSHRWMPIVSRTLLGGCLFFWIVLA
ncbi:MAG TPA: PrsW family intramembrane metalloprotease, partial [Spirochaetia bacterium]|nr:PrsW family intramembrane metalloprotease [Spirochaetia bacterium]